MLQFLHQKLRAQKSAFSAIVHLFAEVARSKVEFRIPILFRYLCRVSVQALRVGELGVQSLYRANSGTISPIR